MDELDELMDTEIMNKQKELVAQTIVASKFIPKNSPFPIPKSNEVPDQQIHGMKGVVVFKGIINVTLYPNGKMSAHISRPLGADQRFDPKKKKIKKSTIQFGEVKQSSIGLG